MERAWLHLRFVYEKSSSFVLLQSIRTFKMLQELLCVFLLHSYIIEIPMLFYILKIFTLPICREDLHTTEKSSPGQINSRLKSGQDRNMCFCMRILLCIYCVACNCGLLLLYTRYVTMSRHRTHSKMHEIALTFKSSQDLSLAFKILWCFKMSCTRKGRLKKLEFITWSFVLEDASLVAFIIACLVSSAIPCCGQTEDIYGLQTNIGCDLWLKQPSYMM